LRRAALKQTVFLALILVMSGTGVMAQPPEEVPAPQDSLQMTEEPEDSGADSLEVIEDTEVPVEDDSEGMIPDNPSSVLESFFLALKSGNSLMVSILISEDGLDEIEIMLDILKENLDNNEGSTMSRLAAAGYTASADEIEDWSPLEYLTSTVVLPVMKSRYSIYDMQIGDYTENGNDLIVPLLFTTSSGLELPFNALLSKDDNQWKVTNFMGLNSFP
jgi:hypothetical protein